jgi:surface carbohydrate biosynthesis protein
MQDKKIVIIVDNPLRDLPACALLAAELAKRHSVYLTPMSQASNDIFVIRPDLVLLNYLRPTNGPLVIKLIDAGIAYSILDTEGGIFMKLENSKETTYTMTLVKSPYIRANVSQVFLWGKELFDQLSERKTYPLSRMHCIGTPRMDFYHGSFEDYFGPALREREKTGRPMILINTSFAGNNPKFSNREKEAAMLVKRFGYTKEFIANLLDQFDLVLKEYIKLTNYLAQAFPRVDFILRPHPFESLEIYKQELGHIPNVKIEGRDTVARWIWESKALIHYECSTALESAFAKRPTFSLSQFKDIRPVEAIRKVTDYCDSFEDMKEKLHEVLAGTYQLSPDLTKNLAEVEKDIYTKVDGMAYYRISEAIHEWFENTPLKKSWLIGYFYFFTQVARSFVKKLVKGRLVPQEKALLEEDLVQVCNNLARALERNVHYARKKFTSSVRIFIS